jgi:hypothetical protein
MDYTRSARIGSAVGGTRDKTAARDGGRTNGQEIAGGACSSRENSRCALIN